MYDMISGHCLCFLSPEPKHEVPLTRPRPLHEKRPSVARHCSVWLLFKQVLACWFLMKLVWGPWKPLPRGGVRRPLLACAGHRWLLGNPGVVKVHLATHRNG